jgi:hypothetical protein
VFAALGWHRAAADKRYSLDRANTRMDHHVRILASMLLLAASGCTTVSTQTSVVSQAGAASGGPGAAVRASAQASAPLQGEFLSIEKWTTTLVTARAVPKLGEVREITDTFNFEGRIFVHATFSSKPGVNGGQPAIEVKWYSRDKLVSVQKAQPTVGKSPYYLASSTSGTALGAGKGRVELVANGTLLASKEFQVTEK